MDSKALGFGAACAPFVMGGVYIGDMWQLDFVNGAAVVLAFTLLPVLLQHFIGVKRYPDFVEWTDNVPWGLFVVGSFFVVAYILYIVLDLPKMDRYGQYTSSVARFFACMVFAVPVCAILSVIVFESSAAREFVMQLLHPKPPPAPQAARPEWGISAQEVSDDLSTFDPARFRDPVGPDSWQQPIQQLEGPPKTQRFKGMKAKR